MTLIKTKKNPVLDRIEAALKLVNEALAAPQFADPGRLTLGEMPVWGDLKSAQRELSRAVTHARGVV